MPRFDSLKGKGLLFFVFLWFVWFMNFSGRTIFSPILPLIEDEFGVSHARATAIFSFMSFGNALALCFAGTLSSFIGHKRTILVSLMLGGLAFFMISQVGVFNFFYPIAFILAFAFGLYLPTIITLITEYYPEALWGKVIARHETATGISIFAAPFIALALLSLFPWRGIPLVFGILFIVCAVLFALSAKDARMDGGASLFKGNLFKRRSLWITGVTWIFMAGCVMGVYFVLPLYLVKELRWNVEYANAVFGMSRIGAVFAIVGSTFLVDRFSLKRSLFVLISVTGLLTMLLAVKEASWLKVVLFLQAGVGAAFSPLALVAISRMFDRESRGPATGLVITIGAVGSSLIPYLLGLSGDIITFRLGIFLLGLATLLASGLILLLRELR